MEALKLPFVMCLGLIGMVSIMGAQIQTQTRYTFEQSLNVIVKFCSPSPRQKSGIFNII